MELVGEMDLTWRIEWVFLGFLTVFALERGHAKPKDHQISLTRSNKEKRIIDSR